MYCYLFLFKVSISSCIFEYFQVIATMTELTQNVIRFLSENGGRQLVDKCVTCKPCRQIPAHLGSNVVYIVAAVLLDQDEKVLLIQEAKTSCYGKWYLPAGRVEKKETLVKAVEREVYEESGYKIQATGLVCVEFDGPTWIRFVFTGMIRGGTIKRKPDEESLQAQWFGKVDENKLRSRDALRLIKLTKEYMKKFGKGNNHLKILPVSCKQSLQVYRLLFIFSWENNSYILLRYTREGLDIPTACFSGELLSVPLIARKYLDKFLADTGSVTPLKLTFGEPKIFGVEHYPVQNLKIPNDGLTINCIIRAKNSVSKKSELPRLKIGALAKWVMIIKGSELDVLIEKKETFGVSFIDLSTYASVTSID